GPAAVGNPWRANSIEWQVSSPPRVFNFDEVPTVVGGPYEYGMPNTVHAVFKEKEPARTGQEAHAHVISPQNQPKHGYVIYDEHVRDAAENRLEMTLALLREAGIQADG